MQLFSEVLDTPTGPMQLLTDQAGHVRVLEWVDLVERRERLLKRHYKKANIAIQDAAERSDAAQRLNAYLAGELDALTGLAVAFGGTPFQQTVWQALRDIPVGETLSYGELAMKIGNPNAVRAVGLANGANPIGVIVPCHRVIGQNGKLTGYGGGLERKRWLLAHEGALTPSIV